MSKQTTTIKVSVIHNLIEDFGLAVDLDRWNDSDRDTKFIRVEFKETHPKGFPPLILYREDVEQSDNPREFACQELQNYLIQYGAYYKQQELQRALGIKTN